MIRNFNCDNCVTFLQQHVQVLCEAPRTPLSKGYEHAQHYLRETLKSFGLVPQNHHFTVWGKGACNIYAETDSQTAEPRILIGAHYETLKHSFLGADDNASGVAVTLELARSIKDSPIVFVFFDREERIGARGLRGSGAFSKFYSKSLSKVIIFDLVGGVLAPFFEKIYFQFGSALPHLSNEELQMFHFPSLFLEPIGKQFPRSDYDAFRRMGIPYTFLSSGTPWYYHTRHDTPEKLHFPKMASLVQVISEKINKPGREPDWSQFLEFLQLLAKTPLLNGGIIARLLKKKTFPNRWELLRFYYYLLPRLRGAGAALFKNSL